MRVKIEIELEITTTVDEIMECTPDNFKEHVEFCLREDFIRDSASDLEYVSVINSITFI